VRYGGVNLAALETHVRGRSDATAEVMLDVAYLKAAGLINSYAIVRHTGAVYQAISTAQDFPYAHRMPCNPTLNIWSIPQLARHHSQRLQDALIEPLAAGDILHRVINYSDNHFEESGACETVDRAVQFIIHEQDTRKRINTNLVRHVIDFIVQPGYAQAYERALDTVSDLADSDRYDYFKDNRLTSPNFDPKLVNDQSIALQLDPGRRPTDAIDVAKDTLWIYLLEHGRYRPALGLAERISQHVDHLKATDAALGANVAGTTISSSVGTTVATGD
jgi:hypothetical protein